MTMTLIGSYISPYVRKVLVCLELKGLDYRLDPIPPFLGNEEFTRLSPLRRVPVLIDGDLVLNDSSVICQYLEEKHPDPSVYPAAIEDRARARWLEEYADTRLGDVLIWRLFFQLGARRYVFGEAPDEAVVEDTRQVQIPQALDYLETQLPAEGLLFGTLSIADIALASMFRTASFVRFAIDAGRWSRCAAYVERVLASEPFVHLARFEEAMLKIPLAEQRAVLAAAGAPLSERTWAAPAPRRGFPRTT